MQLLHILQLLVLMTLANGTPIVAKKIFGPRFSFPLDAGTIFFDGRPLVWSLENYPRDCGLDPRHHRECTANRPGPDYRRHRSRRGNGGRSVLPFREAPAKLAAEPPGARGRAG